MSKLLDRYFLGFITTYILLLTIALKKGLNGSDILIVGLVVGVGFSWLGHVLTRNSDAMHQDRLAENGEGLTLLFVMLVMFLIVTFYDQFLPIFFGEEALKNSLNRKLLFDFVKVCFLVMLPIGIYFYRHQFSLKDWGVLFNPSMSLSRKALSTFFTFLLVIVLFQLFFSHSGRVLRESSWTALEMIMSLMIALIWLVISVGIVEEFFFRVLLQSRFTQLFKSDNAGIYLSAAIFGLAHAPGMYLRGSDTLSPLGPDPGFLASIIYCFLVLSVAGIFLGVIWKNTKNFWLIVLIHALVDLIPKTTWILEN